MPAGRAERGLAARARPEAQRSAGRGVQVAAQQRSQQPPAARPARTLAVAERSPRHARAPRARAAPRAPPGASRSARQTCTAPSRSLGARGPGAPVRPRRALSAVPSLPNIGQRCPLTSPADVRDPPRRLPGLVVIEPAVHGDERGFFVETYRRERARAAWGIPDGRALRPGQPLALHARGRARHALPGRRGRRQARALRARADPRRGRRPAPRLADVRAVGGRGARRRDACASCTCRSASRTASACSATSPTCSTSRPPTTTRRSNAGSPATTRTSASSGRCRPRS